MSRGGWIIKSFQIYLDKLRAPIAREDNRDTTDAYLEAYRSFSFICMLISTDDGSDASKTGIAEAISSHREAVSRLSLVVGRNGSQATQAIIKDYLNATYFNDLNKDAVKIRAGSYAGSRYEPLDKAKPTQEGSAK